MRALLIALVLFAAGCTSAELQSTECTLGLNCTPTPGVAATPTAG